MIVRIDIRRNDGAAVQRRIEALKKANGHSRRNLLAVLNVLSTDNNGIVIDVEQ